MKTHYLSFLMMVILFFMTNQINAQCQLSTGTVSESEAINCLISCGCSIIEIPDGVSVTISEEWNLVDYDNDGVEDNLIVIIYGDGEINFAVNGSNRGQIVLSEGSVLYIEDTNNSDALTASNQGNVRITIGTTTYQGNDFPTIIEAGGVNVNGLLPVDLISFDGKIQNNHVWLNWETASELNNDFFTIEQSRDGKNYDKIGTLMGAGTSNITHRYEFEDKNPLNGKSYYRLQQTDFDGTTVTFDPILIIFQPDGFAFNISFDPASSQSLYLNIIGLTREEAVHFKITDTSGRLIDEKLLKADTYGNIDFVHSVKQHLSSGVYIASITANSIGTRTIKQIKP